MERIVGGPRKDYDELVLGGFSSRACKPGAVTMPYAQSETIGRQEHRRHGFTLLEMFVVLFILLGLMALLFPALQSFRRRARDTVCQNNLRQLSLAMRQVVELQGTIPAAPNPGLTGGWSLEILEFLEEKPLKKAIGQRRPLTEVPAGAIHLPAVFQCPLVETVVSEVPPLEAAHYVLVTVHEEGRWALADAPVHSRFPWLASPEYEMLINPYIRFTGPHYNGFYVGDQSGAVRLMRRK